MPFQTLFSDVIRYSKHFCDVIDELANNTCKNYTKDMQAIKFSKYGQTWYIKANFCKNGRNRGGIVIGLGMGFDLGWVRVAACCFKTYLVVALKTCDAIKVK